MGISVSEYVVLNCGFDATDARVTMLKARRILPDGTEASNTTQGWRVPVPMDPNPHTTITYTLIIKEADWQYSDPQYSGRMQSLRLWIVPNGDPSQASQSWVSQSTLILNDKGEGGGTFTMNPGIAVSFHAWLGIDMIGGPMGPPSGMESLILRGLLISETTST